MGETESDVRSRIWALAILSVGSTCFLVPRRCASSLLWASLLCAEEAKAVGVAFDYRKLDDIDPSNRSS